MVSKLKKIRTLKLYKTTVLKKVLIDKLQLVNKIPDPDRSLENIFKWIKASFEANNDGGSSAYYSFTDGWKASYPETTGYLIPTLYDYYSYTKNEEWRTLAKKASDWLIKIQHIEGGWQGLQVDKKCDLRVFNTAMILDGLIAAYEVEKEKKYLDSAISGFKWTFSKMDAKGFFTENNVSDGGSFDTLVVACLLMVYQYLPENEKESFLPKITNSLDAHLTLQFENGLFQRCNFNTSYKNTSLLHHIGYTLDGLMISSEILNNEKYYLAAKKTALKLLSKFEVSLELPAFTSDDWTSFKDLYGVRSSLCLTGYSQIAIVFFKIYKHDNDLRFLSAALKINDIVSAIGNYRSLNKGISFGLAGSYPVNGNYQPYKFVNWSAKYHAESVLLSLGKSRSKKK